MKLGAIRLTERFFPDSRSRPSTVDECRHYVRAALAPAARELTALAPEVTVGSSGTISTLAAMAALARGEQPRQLNGLGFTRDELERVVDDIVAAGTSARRRRLEGLDERRVDIIVGGSLLLSEIFRALGVEEMTVSGYALREGVLLDRWSGPGEQAIAHLRDLRRGNVERLAAQLDPDVHHARHCAALAVQLFDQTRVRHGLDDQDRELLWAAATLHNVGLFISHASHHKHTYYVIRNSEKLTGFSDREIELVAQAARYHRKSFPADKHPEFAALSDDDKYLVRVLAGLLRIAIGLDRSHRELVQHVTVTADRRGRDLVIQPAAVPGTDLDLELYAARERSNLLAEVLGVGVRIEPVDLAKTSV
jgi:exopolyphosphatase/guanosine-5'-triphosphate,3'-diphosphate pyrophosphatase